ncbi:hypothetical protein ABZS29_27705 [Kribbella sp. NPDC005582]|uniref:hypothetical protein n=1 Tax=Kribbella sp. NPDC005582 TaxID=3156893 RepID=UPI00339E36EB
MRIPRKALTAIALLAAATGFAVPASPAFAYNPPAYNEKSQYLAWNAPVGSPQACVQRTLRLAAGDYVWSEFVNHTSEWKSRSIYLRDDTYVWTTCIQSVGKYSGGYAQYEEVTWLRGSSHNEASMIANDYVTASGYYTVGSELLPLF